MPMACGWSPCGCECTACPPGRAALGPSGWEVPLSYKDPRDTSGKMEKQKLNQDLSAGFGIEGATKRGESSTVFCEGVGPFTAVS